MPKKLTQKQVIEQFRIIHGEVYDYSLVKYVNNRTKVSIVCKKHGLFEQLPADHKAGVGCVLCGYDAAKSKQRLPQKKAIDEFKIIHNDRYDYSKVEYVNSKTSVAIVCKKHGLFFQKPEFHKAGHGCPQCGVDKNANKKRLDQGVVIKRFGVTHKHRYDYSKVEYVNSSTPVEIICKTHGSFFQVPYEHMKGANCPLCAFSEKSRGSHYTQDRLIDEFKAIHGDLYKYNDVNFVRIDKLVTIICRKHGEFEQLPYVHKQGSGCPVCAGQNLDTEKVVSQFREVHGSRYSYDLVEYKGVEKKVKIYCPVHGEFEQLPTSHKSGNGCPSCGEYGFDGNKPAILYYLKIDNGLAYKIGITNSTVEERYKKYELPRISIISIWSFEIGFDARNIESDILKKHSIHKYIGEPLLSSGNTELFDRDVLGLE